MERREFLEAAVGAALGGVLCPWSEAATPANGPGGTFEIEILHVNDAHGHLRPYRHKGHSVGGYARLATLVHRLRGQYRARHAKVQHNHLLLVDSGDLFDKGDALTYRSRGLAAIDMLNHLHTDVWVPGNGDFYAGMSNLRERFKQFHGSPIAANVVWRNDPGKTITRPYVVKHAGHVRIAFLGLCHLHSSQQVMKKDVKLLGAAATAEKYIKHIRAHKEADIIIPVTHLGLYGDTIDHSHGDRHLAENVTGFRVILGGHSHHALPHGTTFLNPNKHKVLVCQAGKYLRYLGVLTLTLRKTGHRYEVVAAKDYLLPIDAAIKPDPKITAHLDALCKQYNLPAEHEGKEDYPLPKVGHK